MRQDVLGRKDAFGKPGRIGRFEISDPVCMDALGPTWAGYIADGAAIGALPSGVVASSTEIATLVERLAGKVISERQRALAEGAPMPVFGSKPPSNRATTRPDEEAHITIEIPRHDGRVENDAETRVESPVPAPRPTDSKKPSGKERSGTSPGAFRPSGI